MSGEQAHIAARIARATRGIDFDEWGPQPDPMPTPVEVVQLLTPVVRRLRPASTLDGRPTEAEAVAALKRNNPRRSQDWDWLRRGIVLARYSAG